MKNVKSVKLNTTIKELFKSWIKFTAPFHRLRAQPQSILALFLYYHYKYSREITNKKILWKLVFDYETKAAIKEELDISDAVMQNTMTYFRKKGVIVKEAINPAYIPNLDKDSKTFNIIYTFNIIDG